jgi:hypothetical protein
METVHLGFTLVFFLGISAVAVAALYWVIRLAVRHALQDVERARSGAARRNG